MKIVAALVVMLALTGCVSVPATAPTYTRAADPQGGQANLYIYRIGAYPTLRTPTIRVDGKMVFKPAERAYTVIPLSQGQHTVKVDWPWDTGWPDLEFPITMADQPLYVRISGSYTPSPSLWGVDTMGSYAHKVDQPAAEAEITACCRYVAPVN